MGHVNLDRFLFADRLPDPERTTPLRGQAVHLGGTATNIARAAARVGLRTALVSAVGPDFPPAFAATLRGEGIDLSGVKHRSDRASSTCFIVEDGRGGQMTLIDQGPLADGLRAPFSASVARSASFVHLTTGPPAAVLALARAVRGRARLAVDPAQEIHYRWNAVDLRRLLAEAEVLFGNRTEIAAAADLLGLSGPRALLDRVPLIVGTLGPAGAVAYSRRGTERVPGRKARRVRQVTGAGDAFRGGFYGGWIRGAPVRRCLEGGVRSATRWIEGSGSLSDRHSDRPREGWP